MDASRLLPVLGAFLFLLPMLWRPEVTGHSTAMEGVYLFSVWAVLIGVARLFAPGLAASGVLAEGPASSDLPSALPSEGTKAERDGDREGG